MSPEEVRKNLHHQIWYSVTNQEEKEIEEKKIVSYLKKKLIVVSKVIAHGRLDICVSFSKVGN